MESRSCGRSRAVAQNVTTRSRDAAACRCGSKWAGLLEGIGVSKPERPPALNEHSKFLTLSRNPHVVAAVISHVCGSGFRGAGEGDRLATLKVEDPVYRLSHKQRIGSPPGVCHEALIRAEWQIIPATEVPYVADIVIGQAIIKCGA